MSDPRIRPRDRDEVQGGVRKIFDTYQRERGNIPNMFRTIAARPRHLETLIEHFRTVMNEGDVHPLLKELISIRVSSINKCRY